MRNLNKLIFIAVFVVACLFINSTFVSAATLNIRSLLKNGSSGEQVKLLQKELNSVKNTNRKISILP